MKRLLPLALVLAGCMADAPDAPLPTVDIPLRNPTAPVASQSDASIDRLQGGWVVVAGAGLRPGETVTISDTGMTLRGVTFPMRGLGEGRFDVAGDPLWVHWLDVGARTAVLGDPNGARVWIMDRTGKPGDRLAPAREILEWYGYDLGRVDGV